MKCHELRHSWSVPVEMRVADDHEDILTLELRQPEFKGGDTWSGRGYARAKR